MYNFNVFLVVSLTLFVAPLSAHAGMSQKIHAEVNRSIEVLSNDEDRQGFPDDLIGGGTRVNSSISTADR